MWFTDAQRRRLAAKARTIAAGFTYEMTSGGLFTAIPHFSIGFTDPFVVWVDGSPLLGTYGPGNSVDIGPMESTIRGIAPA